jgi:hypothetical protein
MSDLWHEASADHDYEARETALAQAEAQMQPVYAFLYQSRSGRELEHRMAFAGHRIVHVATACGLEPAELEETARRRWALLKEALPEGTDPLAQTLDSGRAFGTGPEKPDEHREGPDFEHGYSEIPPGPPGGPAPAVTQVAEPEVPPGPFSEPTASLCRCGSKITKKGKCKVCRHAAAGCMCRTADVTSGTAPVTGMPSTGAGGAAVPAGVGTTPVGPDGMRGGRMPGRAQQPAAAQGAPGGGAAGGFDLTPAQDVTAARRPDPVRRQVEAIAASVAASNPYLSGTECRRVARRVVGSYLQRQGDLASSVMSDEPWAGSPGAQPSGGDGDKGGGMLEHGLEWRGLKSMMPGGGAGAGAGEAAGLGGELAGAAELAAL